jgi:hypothetical protein
MSCAAIMQNRTRCHRTRAPCDISDSRSSLRSTEHQLGDAFRSSKVAARGNAAWDDWVAPPSVGAGLFVAAGREDSVAVLPKRHARFLERFNAAKAARNDASAGGGAGGQDGVTSFGALGPDRVGRAD